MDPKLKVAIIKKTPDSIQFEIDRNSFESFCNAIGLFREEFLHYLDASEKDRRQGRVTKRRSLHELIPK